MKTYELALHRNYVSSWRLAEAFRELMQNSLDNPGGFKFEVSDGFPATVTLTSFKTEIPVRALLLGYTTKEQDKDAIGQFGEGLKLALLVLKREGFNVKIATREVIWFPDFKTSEDFGEETLVISEYYSNSSESAENVVINISNLSVENLETIKDTCLFLRKEAYYGEKLTTPFGDIYTSLKGKLFVGGLFVCETENTYSYDIKPEFLQLDRDRQTVSYWKLSEITARMWESLEIKTKLAEGVASGAADFSYFQYWRPESVVEACVEHFWKEEGMAALPVDSGEDFEFLSSKKAVKPVFIKEPIYAGLLKAASDFMKKLTSLKKALSPEAVLKKFFKENEEIMSEDLKKNFRRLIKQVKAESWKN